ncbi:MAG: type II toxin-antitoxin system VapC family toxin [Treponema sp.]|jgi:predicted nucleic acid-binding protein|nr:type II toxin-antitoxin system VapC family toxin [Treponema sp.]
MARVKYLLDTTTALDLFKGLEEVKPIKVLLQHTNVYISIITRIEMLAYPHITPEMERRINIFLKSVMVIPLTKKVERNTILIRRSKRLKIPDAIIAASALSVKATIISRDDHLLGLNWPGLQSISG